MPPAIAIPAVLGVAGMVSQNSQNKSAQKNNDNANAAAVANTDAAYTQAQNSLNPYLQAGAAPAGGTIGRPTAMSAGAAPQQRVDVQSLLAGLGGGAPPASGGPSQGPHAQPGTAVSQPPLDIASLISSFRRPV